MNLIFIGAGKMGLPMAKHLCSVGHSVLVFDNSEAARDNAVKEGLQITKSLRDDLLCADVIISSLPHDSALLDVAQVVAECAHLNTIYIDTSTVSLRASAIAAEMCAKKGIIHVRATVSGNNKMAEMAQLTVMASGSEEAYLKVKPLLEAFSTSQFYLGDGEQARLMKLIVNLMIAATSGMLAEALTLGEKGGLDWKQMWDVIGASAVGSPIIKAKSTQLRVRDYTPTFTVEQMLKDVGLILAAGGQLHVPLALTSSISQLLQTAVAHGDANLDYAAIIRSVERSSGLKG